MRTHQDLDRRSLALHRLAVANVIKNPALFDEIKDLLEHWKTIVSKSSQPYIIRWDDLAKQGMDVFLAKAVEESQDGDAMRQSSPFSPALTVKERSDFFANWKWSDDNGSD
jgi:hypothetical protein